MSRRNKLGKFTELLTFANVLESQAPDSPDLVLHEGETVQRQGRWRADHFGNDNPLILELACGHGDYSVQLAQRYLDKNFIGVDIKGARIWRGARYALEHHITNVAFLRCNIEFIHNFFVAGEVDELWITFPDPFLKEKKYNRRLTSPQFLERYKKILAPSGKINLKTDSDEFYQHTKEVIQERQLTTYLDDDHIYSRSELIHPDLDIKTHYEKMHLEKGKMIKFLVFGW